MATSTIFNFNFNNSEIVDSTGQWYDATTGTPTTEFIEHDGNTALLQRAYIAETSYLRDINPVFFQSRDPTFTAHTYTIELQIYPLRDSGGFGPESGPVLDFNPDADDEEGWVRLNAGQRASISNTFYWREYGLGPDGSGIPFLTVTAADGTYNRWYSIRIERVDDGTNTGATIKIYVDGTLVVNETLTHPQDARKGRIGDSIRYTYRRSSIDPQGAGVAIDNFKLTAGIAPSRVVDVSLANLQRNNANLLSFIKGKVPTVNNGTLTIQKNGTNVATFTANSSTNATANITVPTKTSDLTNDSGFITSDNTKIPLAGSNQISGSLIPATTDAYDLGGSSYQWNNAYIKSLTINGTACGDILTHNASEFVDVTTAQTIGGVKTFSNGDKTFSDSAPLRIQGCNKGNEFSNNARTVLELRSNRDTADKSCIYITKFRQNRAQGSMGANDNVILTMDVLENEVRTNDLLRFTAHNWINDVPTEVYLEPAAEASNIQSFLGSSIRPWGDTTTNAINGINPGALSLPSTYVNVDTTNWILDGSNVNIFTPTSDGWLGIQVTDTVYDQMHYVFVSRNDNVSYHSQNVLSPINALWDGEYHGCVFIPVIKNVGYDIRCICSTIVATFYPCQGNV